MVLLPKREIVHLHLHTEFSLLDGVRPVPEFINAAKKKGINQFAITEHGNIASFMSFYLDALKPENNIKPICGMEAYVVNDALIKKKEESRSSHLVLLARTNEGMHNLFKLSNFSWNEGFYYRPKVDFERLKLYSEGLTALTACSGGVISNAIRYGGWKGAIEKLNILKSIFGKNLYLEIQLMEEVYDSSLERVERKINLIKDENLRKEKQALLAQQKGIYSELLNRHVNELAIQPDFKEKMYELLGDSWLDQISVNKYMIKLSKKFDVPIVVTGDCHYPYKGDHKLQDLTIRVGFGGWKQARNGADDKSASTGRGYYSKELYVKSNKDFEFSRRKFHPYLPKKYLVKAIKNTHKIGDSVTTEIPIGKHQLPEFPIKTHILHKRNDTKEKLFQRIVSLGFEENVKPKIKKSQFQEYMQRLQFEIETIEKANFIDYFLIIEDIVRWSRSNNIHCVARGSVAGSLVAYSLDITNIDPIQYKLLFERFLNPTRVSGERAKSADALPDVDMDFEKFGRDKVKQYITKKYGEDRVLTIGSYGTSGLKMLVKDFAKVMDYKIGKNVYDYPQINKITNSMEMNIKSIEDACDSSEIFKEFYLENQGWFETYIRPMIGQIRSMSKHAAGVLITPTPFTEWVPVRTSTIEDEDTGSAKVIISQWEDVYCERRGLLKLDVLGVKQLDVFHKCIDLIRKNHGIDLDLEKIETDDEAVYKKFHHGDNFGVFQFNSQLQSGYMRKMKPDSIEDLCVCNALLRPGPMAEGSHEKFIELKSGEAQPDYDHEVVIPYLKSTYGLLVYQEQLMQVSHVLGGLTLAEADIMRSAIKKKDPKLMEPFHNKIVEGCVSKGLKEKHAIKVWDKIVAFSLYSFNKSHAATYALQGYYCQWLKTYFPTEFYAATLEFASTDFKKNENIYTHRQHAIEEGIKFTSPSISRNATEFSITPKGSIVWPIKAIKGIGDKAAVAVGKVKDIKSFEDFFKRVEKRTVNKRVMEKLIMADCFKKFGKPQDIMKEYYHSRKESMPDNYENISTFGWKQLKDDTLGYISESYKDVLKDNFSENIMSGKQFDEAQKGSRVCIGGIVTRFKEHKARNGTMAFLRVEDRLEAYDIVIFASVYPGIEEKPKTGSIVEIRGRKDISPRKEIQVVLGDTTRDKLFVLG